MSNGPEITPLASPPTSEPWVPLWPLQPSALGELAYAEITANVNVTAISEATAQTVVTAPAITLDGATPILVEFYSPLVSPAATAPLFLVLFDGSTAQGFMAGTQSSARQVGICLSAPHEG